MILRLWFGTYASGAKKRISKGFRGGNENLSISRRGTWPNRADFASDVKWTSDRLHELEMVDQKGTLKPPEASVK